jgi:hypothetical protein
VPALQCVLELQPQLRGEILEIDAGGADELAIGDEAVGVGSAMSLPPVVMASAEDLRRIRDPEAAKRQPALCRRGVARSQVGRVPGSARTRSAGSGPASPPPRSSNAATSASTSRRTAVASWSATRCRSASRSRPSSRSDPTRTGCRTPAAKSPAVSSDNHPDVHIDPMRSHMSTAQATSNKATFSLFQDAMNTGDAEVISKTIDEVVEPNVLFHAPVPNDATGARALKQVWAVLLRAFPDLHVAVEDVIAEGTRSSAGTRLPGPTRASTGASHQPANPSRTTRSSSSASPAAESLRSGASSTSTHRCNNSASFRPSEAPSVRSAARPVRDP